MPENLEQYRGLYEIVNNQNNIRQVEKLYNPTGLFGVQSKFPNAIELFGDWIRQIKKRNQGNITDNSVKVENFIAFLSPQKENEEMIKTIQNLYKENIIKDRTPFDNTLLQFALELDALGIVLEHGKSLGRYREARRNMLSMKPLAAKEPEAKKEQKPAPKKAVQQAEPLKTIAKPVKENKTPGGITIESNDEDSLIFNVESSLKNELPAETKPQVEPESAQKAEEKAEEKPQEKVEEKPEEKIQGVPAIQAERERKPFEKFEKAEMEGKDLNISPEKPTEKRPISGEIPEMQRAPKRPEIIHQRGRVIRRLPGGKRMKVKVKTEEKLRETPKEAAQNRPGAQAQAQAQPQAQVPQQPMRRGEEQEPEETPKKGSSTAGKLAKLAGAGVGAGTVFSLFGFGNSADAATLISHASIALKSITAFLHLFLR